MNDTYIELCLQGEVDLEDIDDFVDRWHESDSTHSLPQYLGMNEEEYSVWVEKPAALPFILFARRLDVPLAEVLDDSEGMPMAARALNPSEASEVLEWLRQTGRA